MLQQCGKYPHVGSLSEPSPCCIRVLRRSTCIQHVRKDILTAEKYEQGWRDMVVANPDNAPAENWVSQVFPKDNYAPERSCCPTLLIC